MNNLDKIDILVMDALEGRQPEEKGKRNLILDITDLRFKKSDILEWMEQQESFTALDVNKHFKIPHGSTHCCTYAYKGYIEVIGTITDKGKRYAKPQKVYRWVK